MGIRQEDYAPVPWIEGNAVQLGPSDVFYTEISGEEMNPELEGGAVRRNAW